MRPPPRSNLPQARQDWWGIGYLHIEKDDVAAGIRNLREDWWMPSTNGFMDARMRPPPRSNPAG